MDQVVDTDKELAHELSQPLQVITILSDRLRDQPEAAVKRAATLIIDQVERITRILRRNTDALLRVPTDLNRLIRESLDLVVMTERPATVDVVVDLADSVTLNIDRVQIEQVLVNLVRNAFQAMEAGRGHRLVVRSSLAADHIEVAVIDDGPGINPAIMQRLFRPHTSSKHDGMGIGLAISQDIVQAHGGNLAVTTSDKGTCFVITLPR
jgi:two-component system sensor kinase FixL